MQRGMWLFVMAATLGLMGRSSFGESSDSYTSDLSTRTKGMLLIRVYDRFFSSIASLHSCFDNENANVEKSNVVIPQILNSSTE